jgi:hypothetical protein
MSTVLPTPAPPNRPILPPFVGGEQVDDLDARGENLLLGVLLGELGRVAVDGEKLLRADRARLVDGLAHDVENAAEGLGADGHHDGVGRGEHVLAAAEAVGGVHGDGAHGVFPEVLGDLEHKIPPRVGDGLVGNLQRGIDRGHGARWKLHIDDGSDNLGDSTGGLLRHRWYPRPRGKGRCTPEHRAARAPLPRPERWGQSGSPTSAEATP